MEEAGDAPLAEVSPLLPSALVGVRGSILVEAPGPFAVCWGLRKKRRKPPTSPNFCGRALQSRAQKGGCRAGTVWGYLWCRSALEMRTHPGHFLNWRLQCILHLYPQHPLRYAFNFHLLSQVFLRLLVRREHFKGTSTHMKFPLETSLPLLPHTVLQFSAFLSPLVNQPAATSFLQARSLYRNPPQ